MKEFSNASETEGYEVEQKHTCVFESNNSLLQKVLMSATDISQMSTLLMFFLPFLWGTKC